MLVPKATSCVEVVYHPTGGTMLEQQIKTVIALRMEENDAWNRNLGISKVLVVPFPLRLGSALPAVSVLFSKHRL